MILVFNLQLRFLPQRVIYFTKFSKYSLKAYHVSVFMLLAAGDKNL